jgi:hypothetical protein
MTAIGTMPPFTVTPSYMPDAPLAVLDIEIEHPLESLASLLLSGTCHRIMAVDKRLVQPVFSGRLTPLAPPTPIHRCQPHTKLAIERSCLTRFYRVFGAAVTKKLRALE